MRKMFVHISLINNPKSKKDGLWTVSICENIMDRMETVFINESKKACIEYAKSLNENPIISDGNDYGAKW